MADAVEHAELDMVVVGRGLACGDQAHEAVVLAVHEEHRALHRRGEVLVDAAGQVQQQGSRRFGVRTRGLRVAVPLGRERDEAASQVGVEATRVVQAPRQGRVDQAFRTEHAGAGAHDSTAERRHHHRREAREPEEVDHAGPWVWERGIDQHEAGDEIGTPGGDPDRDRCPHRVADRDRWTLDLEERGYKLAVGRDRRRAFRRARSSEADEIDGGDRRTKGVGQRLTDRLPRQRVRAEPVDEKNAVLVLTRLDRCPLHGVHSHTVGLEVVRAPERRAT